jgi:hypothetical protein
MTTSASIRSVAHRADSTSSRSTHPIVRARTGIAVVLTAISVGMGLALGLMLGKVALALYLATLPVPLCLLWFSSDVLRSDERE